MAKKEEKETKKNNVHEINVKIEGENWTKALDKAFKEKQKNVKVDGFRRIFIYRCSWYGVTRCLYEGYGRI